jgi:hypothetical protein
MRILDFVEAVHEYVKGDGNVFLDESRSTMTSVDYFPIVPMRSFAMRAGNLKIPKTIERACHDRHVC